MLEITCNDRLGKKVRVKCNPDDTIGDLKKLIAAQTGTHWEKIVLKKWYTIYKDHIKLQDCILYPNCVRQTSDPRLPNRSSRIMIFLNRDISDEIHDGMNIELYYQ